MPRGGARENAGRKPKLTFEERLEIGSECEERWREADKANIEAEFAKTTQNVSKEHAKANQVPVHERKAWLKSQAGRDYKDDVSLALREDQDISDEEERDRPRILQITVKRPKGPGKQIIQQVAAQESKRLNREISIHMVKRCWAEFRKLQRRVKF